MFQLGHHTLWLNSKHKKSDNKPHISSGNSIDESVVAEVATLTRDNKFSYHNVVKAVRGIFIGFYAIVTETSDTNRMNELDEFEKSFLKNYFGKWIVNVNNLNSREIKDFIRVRAYVDGGS